MAMIAQSTEATMSENLYISMLNTAAILGSKDARTKEETLAYTSILRHLEAIARINTLFVNDAISQHLDVTNESNNSRSAA